MGVEAAALRQRIGTDAYSSGGPPGGIREPPGRIYSGYSNTSGGTGASG